MQPEITPDTSTLIALAGLASFFVCLVFLWIIGFRHYEKRMVTMVPALPDAAVSPAESATLESEQRNVRAVEVPLAGSLDGGPLLGGRVILVADPPELEEPCHPTRDPRPGVIYNRCGDRLVVGKLPPAEALPRCYWN